MSAETVPSAAGIKMRNIGMVFVIVVPLVFLSRHVPLPATENFDTFSYLFPLFFVCIGLYALTGMLRRGKVILHFGYHPISILMIPCAGLLILMGSYGLAFEATTPGKLEMAIHGIAMGFGFGACHIAGRSVCENGIWFMGSLLRWDAIKNIVWDPCGGNEFRYEMRRNWWFPWRYGIITVPEKHLSEFKALVAQHVDGPRSDHVSDPDEFV